MTCSATLHYLGLLMRRLTGCGTSRGAAGACHIIFRDGHCKVVGALVLAVHYDQPDRPKHLPTVS